MISEECIDGALEILEHASKGPALWVEPVTGVDDKGERRLPSQEFIRMLRDGEHVGPRAEDLPKVHGVSIACDAIEAVVDGGDHLVVAITGNGPTSEANARAIACMLNPEYGYGTALRELRATRASNERIRMRLRSWLEAHHDGDEPGVDVIASIVESIDG